MSTARERALKRFGLVAAGALVALGLGGCVTETPAAAGGSYVSVDGTVTEFAVDQRGEPIDFGGTLDTGEQFDSTNSRGQVLVVNFWYAACPPCRLEAPWLQALSEEFASQGVEFVGINVRDGTSVSLAFAGAFSVTYPSIIDTDGGAALAFTGVASPNAVPTTLVLDRSGRVASRIIGLLDEGVLRTLIESAVQEPSEP